MSQNDEAPLPTSLSGELEAAITRCFYRKEGAERRRCAQRAGLQSPLWLWTYDGAAAAAAPCVGSKSEKEPTALHIEVQKAVHLVQWLLWNNVAPSSIAVVLPLAWKSHFRSTFTKTMQDAAQREQQRHARAAERGANTAFATAAPSVEGLVPHLLAQHELSAMNVRDKKEYTYDVVLYLLGAKPTLEAVEGVMRQERYLKDTLHAAQSAFIVCADVGWRAPSLLARWTEWRLFVQKMTEETPFVSLTPADGPAGTEAEEPPRFPTMAGPHLPLCCAAHPGQRELVDGVKSVVPFCQHICRQLYGCQQEDHLCSESCHLAHRHHACPFVCGTKLPCGHACLVSCGSRCNCYEVVEKPLPCSHEEVAGLDQETLQPLYRTVHHVFKGVCADAALPCAVTYTTECARCLGPLTVQCFEAQETGHTLENRTLVCPACKRAEREIRAGVLANILLATEEHKRKMKTELQRTVHQQKKAAMQGLFHAGARVEIVDPTRCVPPLFADDFPGILFVDMDDPACYQKLEGAYGTFVSSHVDLMDRSEVRSLVRLPDGRHVLVADGGLGMIRALTSNVTGSHQAQGALLIDYHVAEEGASGERSTDAAEFAAAKATVGKRYYLSQPVPCSLLESGFLADRIVLVTAIDPSEPKQVCVACEQYTVRRQAPEMPTVAQAVEEDDVPEAKRVRTEEADCGGEKAETAKRTAAAVGHLETEKEVLTAIAPLDFLEPLTGFTIGKQVYVTNAARQITNPHDMELLQCAVRYEAAAVLSGTSPIALEKAVVTAAALDEASPYTLVGLMNPPCNAETENMGPCALLQRPTATTRYRTAERARPPRHGKGDRGNQRDTASPCMAAPPHPSGAQAAAAAPSLAVVPLAFTAPDELSEAEEKMDAAAQAEFQQRLQEAVNKRNEEFALRNEEAAFRAQQAMPPVSEAELAAGRTVYSVPVPVPTPQQIAEARKQHTQLPLPGQTARLTKIRDTLVTKKERLALPAWVEGMRRTFEEDKERDKASMRHVQHQVLQSGAK